MLLAIVLLLHGDSVKDRLPPRVEQVRLALRERLLVCGVRPGMTMEEVVGVLGYRGCNRNCGFAEVREYLYPLADVTVFYSWIKGKGTSQTDLWSEACPNARCTQCWPSC
jgi:hypothetical protein